MKELLWMKNRITEIKIQLKMQVKAKKISRMWAQRQGMETCTHLLLHWISIYSVICLNQARAEGVAVNTNISVFLEVMGWKRKWCRKKLKPMELWRSNKGSRILIQNEFQERKQKTEQIEKATQQTKMNK